jgi:DNA-binding NarL/FixJ family response regulator
MYLANFVADFGYEVVVSVRSGSAAIAKAMAVSPDVALMNIRLADGSGARFFLESIRG